MESGATVGSTFYAWGAQIDEPNKTGSVRWIVNAPTATLDRLIVHISILQSGQGSPHHHHPQEEVVLIKEGSVRYWINGKVYDAGAGSMIFLSADAVHTPYNVTQNPAVYYVIAMYTPATPKAPGGPADTWAAPGELHSGLFQCEQMPKVPTAYGSRQLVVSSPTATLSKLESVVVTLNPGAETSILTDPADELIFVKSGLVEIKINGVAGRLGTGSVCFKASNDQHRIKNIGPGPAVYQLLKFVTPRTIARSPAPSPSPSP